MRKIRCRSVVLGAGKMLSDFNLLRKSRLIKWRSSSIFVKRSGYLLLG